MPELKRRSNPVLADVFSRLGYMERQGSGFKKITEAYYAAYNYRAELEPKFYSDGTLFQVTLYNLNYEQGTEKPVVSEDNRLFEGQKPVVSEDKQLFEGLLLGLKARTSVKETVIKLYRKFGFDMAFARADIMKLAGITSSPAGRLVDKLKDAGLIIPVIGQGKGKYKFTIPKK